MRLIFELMDGVKQLALSNVGGPQGGPHPFH